MTQAAPVAPTPQPTPLGPPHNIEAEELLLGSVLLDPDAIGRVASLVTPEAFYLAAHRQIFSTALMLYGQGKPTDLTSVTTWLADTGRLQQVGGAGRLMQLLEQVSTTAAIDQVAGLVMDKFLRRQLITASQDVIGLATAQDTPLADALAAAEQKIFAVGQQRPRQGLSGIDRVLLSTFEEIEGRSQGAATAGLPVGFRDLDAMTQGLQRSDLVIIAARPAMGKTAITLNMARNMARQHDLPVCVFSLEMSKEQLAYRLLAMETGIENTRLRTGRLHDDEWPLLGQGIHELAKLPIFIDDSATIGVLEMRSLCRRLVAETGRELGMVVIDYLQLMDAASGSDNRVQELSRITRGLKAMARELNVPVVALSQLSRGVESRTNKRPMLSDLRESGSIEQDADLVMMIYRDEYYNPDTPDRGITELIISKHRHGPVGTVKLLFEPQFTRFRSVVA